MGVYLIEREIFDEQYTGSTKTKFRSRANNYKSTQRKFVNKEAVPKQALKQKRFHEQLKLGVKLFKPLKNLFSSSCS